MPNYLITAPDGRKFKVSAPEGATKEDALRYVQSRMVAKTEVPEERYDPTEGMSAYEKLMAGAGKSVVDLGRGVRQLAAEGGNRIGLVKDETVRKLREEETERARLDAPLMKDAAGQIGYVGGTLATTLLPVAAATRGAQAAGLVRTAAAGRAFMAPQTIRGGMAAGAIEGAMRPVGTGESRAENIGVGALAGGAGAGLAQGISKVAQPVKEAADATWRKSVEVLKKAGIPLDAANISGGKRMAWVKRHVADNPITKTGQEAFAENQRKAFTRAALRTIGEEADHAGDAVLQRAEGRIGSVYNDFAARFGMKIDQTLAQQLDNLAADIAEEVSSPGVLIKQIERIREAAQAQMTKQAAGAPVTGKVAQRIDSALGRLRKSSDGLTRHYAGEIQKTLRKAIESAAPDAEAEALRTARKQWRNLIAIKKSRAKDASRTISILRLSSQNGADDLMELAAAARQVLPDSFQNSGTAGRIAELAVPGLAVGAIGGLAEGDITGAAKWATVGLAAPYAGVAALRYPGMATTGMQGSIRNALMSPALRGALTQAPIGYYLSEPAR